jgi:hypothetical protein
MEVTGEWLTELARSGLSWWILWKLFEPNFCMASLLNLGKTAFRPPYSFFFNCFELGY